MYPFFLGFAPYFGQKYPFFCYIFFTLIPLRLIGHYDLFWPGLLSDLFWDTLALTSSDQTFTWYPVTKLFSRYILNRPCTWSLLSGFTWSPLATHLTLSSNLTFDLISSDQTFWLISDVQDLWIDFFLIGSNKIFHLILLTRPLTWSLLTVPTGHISSYCIPSEWNFYLISCGKSFDLILSDQNIYLNGPFT